MPAWRSKSRCSGDPCVIVDTGNCFETVGNAVVYGS